MTQVRGTTQTRAAEPAAWLFRWRNPATAALRYLFPVALAALAFAFLLGFVRVRVAAPRFKIASKASLTQVPAIGSGAAWALRAKEGGPWRSRYEPSDWYAYAPMQEEVLRATRIPARPYVADLLPLPPEGPVAPPPLAAKGDPVLPHRTAELAVRNELAGWRLAPVLFPLSPVGAADMPRELPAFAGEIDAAMVAAHWRFLLHLDPAGGVIDAVSLTKVPGTTASMLESWLRGLRFDAKLAAGGGWLAVGIEFNNQATHGTDAH